MLQAYLPPEAWKFDKELFQKNNQIEVCPLPNVNMEEFQNFLWCIIRSYNIHSRHPATCHKGEVGKYRCRLGMPQHCRDKETYLVEICWNNTNLGLEKTPIARLKFSPSINASKDPLASNDQRAILIDLYRPQPDIITPTKGNYYYYYY